MSGRARDEAGQVLVLLLLGLLVVLLGVGGVVMDGGRAFWVQRQLQAAADATALVAARALPDPAVVDSTVAAYGPNGKNHIRGASSASVVATPHCTTSVANCVSANAVTVTTTASISTAFLRLFGVDSLRVSARATACSPCGNRPLDVMIVLDRTGSMCQFQSGASDPACTDLRNARDGVKAFLQLMDPRIDHVGLAVLPPASSVAGRCGAPAGYSDDPKTYVVVPLSDDYLTSTGAINSGSALVSTLDCVRGSGSTAYAAAIDAAQAELVAHGRPDVPNAIVFLSDGAANDGPLGWKTVTIGGVKMQVPVRDTEERVQPCHAGIAAAGRAAAAETTVYAIGYDVVNGSNGTQICANANTHDAEVPAITAYQALQQIAGPGNFYVKPDPGQLKTIFTSIATDILHGTSKLIAEDA